MRPGCTGTVVGGRRLNDYGVDRIIDAWCGQPMSTASWQVVGILFQLFVCAWAAVRGGWPERCAVAVIIAGSILSPLASGSLSPDWCEIGLHRFLVELAVLVGLGTIALYSDRYWPLWATAFQIPPVLIFAAKMTGADVPPRVLSQGTEFWFFPIMAMLAIGVANRPRTQKSSERFFDMLIRALQKHSRRD
jgi:hypothetical protein